MESHIFLYIITERLFNEVLVLQVMNFKETKKETQGFLKNESLA